MGIFDFLKKKEKPVNSAYYAPTMNGTLPFYTSFGDTIYSSDIVVQSIRCKANEFRKLEPRHIRDDGVTRKTIYDSSVSRVLRQPNEIMTTSDMLEKICILLELNKNAYIYPYSYISNGEERIFKGLYVLKPRTVYYLVDKANKYYVEMLFDSGATVTLPRDQIIHVRKDYGVNDYFGGGAFGGGVDSANLMRAITEYDKLTQSIAKALELSCSINGLLRVNTYLDDKKQIEERQAFEEKLRNNESGLLVTDLKSEYVNIPRDIKLVDADTLKFFYENITRANGVSLAILNGDYTKAQKEAFYEHALEAEIKSLGQAMTQVLFTERERAFGNRITLYPNDIHFMSMSEKINALTAGLPAGIFTRNEAREMLGYPPIENGDQIPQGYNHIIDGSTDTTTPTAPQIDETTDTTENVNINVGGADNE